eukprot:763066-Hanusia_phi.AAC.1
MWLWVMALMLMMVGETSEMMGNDVTKGLAPARPCGRLTGFDSTCDVGRMRGGTGARTLPVALHLCDEPHEPVKGAPVCQRGARKEREKTPPPVIDPTAQEETWLSARAHFLPHPLSRAREVPMHIFQQSMVVCSSTLLSPSSSLILSESSVGLLLLPLIPVAQLPKVLDDPAQAMCA